MRYLITDLCYIKHTDKEWEKVCNDIEGVKTLMGLHVIKNGYTPNGDGEYQVEDQTGFVDSGSLALVEVPNGFKAGRGMVLLAKGTSLERAEELYEEALEDL